MKTKYNILEKNLKGRSRGKQVGVFLVLLQRQQVTLPSVARA